jgi:ribosomal protein L11 methyltransferase
MTALLRHAQMLAPRASAPALDRIRDPGWATMWMKRFTPLPVGRRLLIVPPWHRLEHPGRVTVTIKPGQAFGTGHHATTAAMLSVIERLAAQSRIRRALDVGTGSGILAIAMAQLGVPRVIAIDNDRTALANARENVGLNRVARRVELSAGPLRRVRGGFDLIAANILRSTLVRLAPQLIRRLRPGGQLVLGGLLRDEVPDVLAAYRARLRCVAVGMNRRWATIVLAR